jgi:hypothetical protein
MKIVLLIAALLFAAPAFAGSGSDAFSGADNLDLGAAWDVYNDSGGTARPCQIIGNQVYTQADTTRCTEGYNAYIPTAAQYSQITLRYLSDNAGSDAGPMIRLQAPPTYSAYLCRANNIGSGATAAQLQKRVAGILTTLSSDAGITWADNDQLKCEASLSTQTFYQNGVSILTGSDAAFASGRGGLFHSVTGNISLDGFGVDDFIVSDLGGSTRRPIAPMVFR